MTDTAKKPAPRKSLRPAPKSKRLGVYLPVLPDGWSWAIGARGPGNTAVGMRPLEDGRLRVELSSRLVTPAAAKVDSLAEAAATAARLAQLHERVAAIGETEEVATDDAPVEPPQ